MTARGQVQLAQAIGSGALDVHVTIEPLPGAPAELRVQRACALQVPGAVGQVRQRVQSPAPFEHGAHPAGRGERGKDRHGRGHGQRTSILIVPSSTRTGKVSTGR